VVAFPRRIERPEPLFGALMFLGAQDPASGERGARRHCAVLRGMAASFLERWAARIRMRCASKVNLTPVERELLECVAEGLHAREAAQRAGLSCAAVHNYYRRINAKFEVSDKRHAYLRAVESDLLRSDFTGAVDRHHAVREPPLSYALEC
jgi:DNA-binding CsgD family transcriptional regulator